MTYVLRTPGRGLAVETRQLCGPCLLGVIAGELRDRHMLTCWITEGTGECEECRTRRAAGEQHATIDQS